MRGSRPRQSLPRLAIPAENSSSSVDPCAPAPATVTRRAPARFNARAHAAAEAPVVKTSSTSKMRIPSSRTFSTTNAPATFTRRLALVSPACGVVALRRVTDRFRTGTFHRFAISRRQQFRLIEAALPSPQPMQRHRDDQIELLLARQRDRHQVSEHARQGLHAAVLKKMNQLAQRAFVRSVRVDRVESGKPQPAQRAAAVFIQRKAIQERSPAGCAEKLSVQRSGLAQDKRLHTGIRETS